MHLKTDTPEHHLLLLRNQLEKQKGLFSSNSPPLPLSNCYLFAGESLLLHPGLSATQDDFDWLKQIRKSQNVYFSIKILDSAFSNPLSMSSKTILNDNY